MKRRRPMSVESERREPAMKRVAAPQPVPSTEYKPIYAMNTILESIISSNLRELPCVFCSEMSGQLYSPTELKNHLNESHSALELHACHFCTRAFSSTLGLLNHPCSDFAEYLTTFQYDSIDKFLTPNETIGSEMGESFLPIYIKEASKIQNYRKQSVSFETAPKNHLRFFNAQSEFNRIELGDGNFRFECKVCGHKTKMNVKPNALSQHFSDRHPELRAQASLLLSSQVDSLDAHNESTKSIESELNGNQTVNLSPNGNISVILDKIKQLFCRNDLPYSGVICKNCDSTHCSVLSLRTHIYISHGYKFSILDMSRGTGSVTASEIRQFILKKSERCSPSSTAVADCIMQIFGKHPSKENNSSFRSNGDSVVAVKSEELISQIDDQIEDMDSFDCSMQASLSSSKFSVGNCDDQSDNPFDLNIISGTNMASSSKPYKIPLSSQLESSSSADETRAKCLEAMRNRKLKPCKFNAQQYFRIIIDEDGRGRRYQCTICGHITKPNVCSTALSQHFSDRHPHMRAIANHNAGILSTRPKKRRFSLQNRLAHLSSSAVEPEHVNENPDTAQRASESALNNSTAQNAEPSPIDDIVFGKFLDTCTMDEFERLLRNQQTVLPYFEIAVKANPEISIKLFQTLSILTGRNAESADNKEKIVSFIGELLKRSRTLGLSVLDKISAVISENSLKETSVVKCNSATDVKDIFIVLDELLRKCGY
ncbi:hypothetical protein DdX_05973 [Ditylenchus destructor]|uniref:C2H2-type domain-containing protein n=1 Tax=Ditylenchus destructor TaxID=166010 RepID=A0AAD4N6D7_9BILA|nr:hypothetical protein DdX_05973 [Ditylenchus destructor]